MTAEGVASGTVSVGVFTPPPVFAHNSILDIVWITWIGGIELDVPDAVIGTLDFGGVVGPEVWYAWRVVI